MRLNLFLIFLTTVVTTLSFICSILQILTDDFWKYEILNDSICLTYLYFLMNLNYHAFIICSGPFWMKIGTFGINIFSGNTLWQLFAKSGSTFWPHQLFTVHGLTSLNSLLTVLIRWNIFWLFLKFFSTSIFLAHFYPWTICDKSFQ